MEINPFDKHLKWVKLIPDLQKYIPEEFELLAKGLDDISTETFCCEIRLSDRFILRGEADLNSKRFYSWDVIDTTKSYKPNRLFFKLHIPFTSYNQVGNLLWHWEAIEDDIEEVEDLLEHPY